MKKILWKEIEKIIYRTGKSWSPEDWGPEGQMSYEEYLAREIELFIYQELDRAREEENKRCVDIINRIIQTSGEDSSNQWFDGLRSARESIKLTTK